MTLNEAFNEFILDKRLRGLSSQTIIDYSNIVSIFLRYVGPELALEELTRPMVNRYILYVLDKGIAKATAATYIRNMRIFLVWIYREYGSLSFDPKTIKVPKSPKKEVHIYTATEVQYLLNMAITSIPWITARNRCIIALMLDSGIRQCEVCTLRRSDVDFDRMVMMVTGKGSKQRLVPLGYVSKMLLQDYYSQCPFDESDFVFVDRLGKPLTGNAVRLFVNRLKHKLPFDLTSHKLRHNFATNFCVDNIKKSGSTHVYDLSILMGHESIETTKQYEHFAHELIAVESSISHLDKVFEV